VIDRSDEVREMYAAETDDLLAEMFSGAWLDSQSCRWSTRCPAWCPKASGYW
jgi:hypothetical protein